MSKRLERARRHRRLAEEVRMMAQDWRNQMTEDAERSAQANGTARR